MGSLDYERREVNRANTQHIYNENVRIARLLEEKRIQEVQDERARELLRIREVEALEERNRLERLRLEAAGVIDRASDDSTNQT